MLEFLEHSPLGASSAKRFLACAGSFLLARDLEAQGRPNENTSSEYADLGTAAHALAADCLRDNKEPYEYIGAPYGEPPHGPFTAGKDIDLDAVACYVNECRDLMADGGELIIEATLHFPDIHPLLKGTADFAQWLPGKVLRVRDYKHGEGVPVSPWENEQLLYYAYLVVIRFNLFDESLHTPVDLGIVQPRVYGDEPVKTWETTLWDVINFGDNILLPKMRQLMVPQDLTDDDFQPGEHCQFCPVLMDCPKAQSAYEAITEGEDPAMLSDQELSAYYQKRDLAKKFLTALDATVKARLLSKGHSITAAKLVAPKADRVWAEGAQEALIKKLGAAAYAPRTIMSPAALEKAIPAAKKLVKEWAYKPTATGVTVAPIDDPRPSVQPPSAAETFASYASPDTETYEGF